ncbi:hypothetical protein MGYG_09072 [Nannizzia gypsea CBS 118893]|uniref:Uncharacterized protein n=1 Tax=Arthroderma gypseum (strain ATCC MYA-4604 / CBS 118893) TaxID=535722 RepID=E4UVA8_ARTGP|nr:hypothetical protein MGYG_09072 [Nannizzia gypsea CBS 118893]EFR02235.1 hypothetical protein MGYG_09072 [Nannizzia gypsea CBS 118893]
MHLRRRLIRQRLSALARRRRQTRQEEEEEEEEEERWTAGTIYHAHAGDFPLSMKKKRRSRRGWLSGLLAITSCCILHLASHQPIDQISCKPGLIDKANFR